MSTLIAILCACALVMAVLAMLSWPLLALSGVWAHLSARSHAQVARDIEQALADD